MEERPAQQERLEESPSSSEIIGNSHGLYPGDLNCPVNLFEPGSFLFDDRGPLSSFLYTDEQHSLHSWISPYPTSSYSPNPLEPALAQSSPAPYHGQTTPEVLAYRDTKAGASTDNKSEKPSTSRARSDAGTISMRLNTQEPDENPTSVIKAFDLEEDMQEIQLSKRRAYNEEERREIADTRRRGACPACKQSKRRCHHDDWLEELGGIPLSSSRSSSSNPSIASRRRVLTIPNGFPCDQCSEKFDRNTDLNRHKRRHLSDAEKPQVCPICEKGFIYPKDLRRHMGLHVPRETNYHCPFEGCARSFSRKDNYRRHMHRVHSVTSFTTLPQSELTGSSTSACSGMAESTTSEPSELT